MNKLLFLSLTLLTLPTFAVTSSQFQEATHLAKLPSDFTLVREHSSLKDAPNQTIRKRITEYPTQIVRMDADLKGQQTCEEVLQKVDGFFSDYITPDKFFYNTINYCSYDPNTHYARRFIINSYFDPLDEEAIVYLQKYLVEHNGHDLLGSPFYVENAQGMVVSLDIDAGIEETPDADTLMRLQHDNASHYFPTNYAMRLELIADVRQRFFSNKSNLVLPFIDKWFLTSVWMYQRVLGESNYVELRPELVFLMEKSPKIFTPLLRLYYGHHCSKYESKHCL